MKLEVTRDLAEAIIKMDDLILEAAFTPSQRRAWNNFIVEIEFRFGTLSKTTKMLLDIVLNDETTDSMEKSNEN